MPQLHRIKNIPFSLSVLELQTLTSQNSSSLSSSLLSLMRYDEFYVSICLSLPFIAFHCLSLPFIAFHCLSLNTSESFSKHCCMLQTYRNPVYAQDMSPSFHRVFHHTPDLGRSCKASRWEAEHSRAAAERHSEFISPILPILNLNQFGIKNMCRWWLRLWKSRWRCAVSDFASLRWHDRRWRQLASTTICAHLSSYI
jgi:hypothetical protein